MQNDLKFSGVTPVIINYNGSEDDIYAPLKTSSSDINIVSPSILDDLYTARKDDIIVKIEKGYHERTYVVDYRNPGTISSYEYSPKPTSGENFTIFSKDLFFTDINGDFRFNGKVSDSGNNTDEVTLKYNSTTGKWENKNDWLLDYNDQYFYAGSDSYRVTYDGTSHYVQKWNIIDWGTAAPYNRVDGSTVEDCAYKADNVIHYTDNSTEMLWGQNRYTWNSTDMQWEKTTSYEDVDGGTYFAMYGENHMKVFDGNGNVVDAVIVNFYNNTSEEHIADNWVVILNKDNNTFTRLIPLTVEYGNMDRVFTDDDGYVYYVTTNGSIYNWSWDIDQWVEWVTFPDDVNAMVLDYVIPIQNKRVVIKYQDTNSETKFFILTNIQHPIAYWKEIISPIVTYDTIWEGYKMPNSYSQPVTQNLDSISMTIIDPLSILKYITVDKLFTNNTIYTFKDLINYTLGYIYIDSNKLKVERNVSYGGAFDYDSHNGLLDMQIQMSNFWDEGGEPSTIYDMITELLKPFCMTIAFDGQTFIIYNPNKTSGTRVFDNYEAWRYGTFDNHYVSAESTVVFDFNSNDWKSQNTQDVQIDINSTYDEVTSVVSTKKPEYSNMAMDLIDYNQTDKYSYIDLNVQRNKTKGYLQKGIAAPAIDTNDYWYYIWNGAYVNSDYGLESHNNLVNGYLNINKAYEYLTGLTGDPTDYGSILNFYGGGDNPTGTGKEQTTEKSVEIKKRITAYAADNGVPLEFLETADLAWDYDSNYIPQTGDDPMSFDPEITKTNSSDSKFGTAKQMQASDRIVYHQKYDMYLNQNNEYSVDLDLIQSYSRTGIDSKVDVYHNNTATNREFILIYDSDEQIYHPYTLTFDTDNFPNMWNSSQVKVNLFYFDRYSTSGGFLPIRLSEVWDKRRIDLYIKKSDNTILQFNGKDWIEVSAVSSANCFYLKKMMNDEKLYHTDFRYNLIETADGSTYSLKDENFVYHTDANGGVVQGSGEHTYTFNRYFVEGNEWYQWINKCSEGALSFKLPAMSDLNAEVVMDVYNSTLLGMTGSDHNYPGPYDTSESLFFEYSGQGKYWDEETQQYVSIALSPSTIGNLYGTIGTTLTKIKFQPYNVSYVKAEHLDLSISITVPESNLGQMFSESDIKYKIVKDKQMIEKFDDLTFDVNTYNQMVNNSFSYIIYEDDFANPDEFIINNVNVRPEIYTTQAYMNWLSVVRKIYKKTLKPIITDFKFTNIRTFIKSPEVGTNKMMVVADSVDLKTNRHSVTAVECQDMDVSTIDQYNAIEIPRRARNDRWNLPTAYKK